MVSADIYDKIVEIMEGLTGSGQPLAEFFAYPESDLRQFPCAIMDLDAGNEQVDLASLTKWQSANFIIRVISRQKNSAEAFRNRLVLMDSIISGFTTAQNIDDLDGICDIFDLSSEPFYSVDDSQQPLFGFDIMIKAKKAVGVQ